MLKIIWFLVLATIFIVFDIYVFQGLKSAISNTGSTARKIFIYSFWVLSVVSVLVVGIAFFSERNVLPRWFYNYFVGIFGMLYLAKFLTIVFLFTEDIVRGVKWLAIKISGKNEYDVSRSKFLGQASLIAGGLLGGSFIYGIVKGAFNYNVVRQKLSFNQLPAAFEGYKIIQISDLHVGSFVSERPLEKAVRLINQEKPDLVLFTGDLVNDRSSETDPFVATLSQIKAKDGVYSVLGNHDYGDYVQWPSQEAKEANLQRLIDVQAGMGWRVLMDENVRLEKAGAHIALIGIQNWGAKARFPKYGDLSKAYKGAENSPVKILMSHDPSHWQAEVLKKFTDVDLMLSGHTHGMQFGVEIPGFIKWSPVKYVYKEWAGLYKQGMQHLYVNRGLGFLGYPGRVGISPEITVFELTNQNIS